MAEEGEDEFLHDSSSLAWVNSLLRALWPKANVALIHFVHEELTPKLQAALPGPLKSVYFSRFSLGDGVPDLGPIDVTRVSESHVQIELGIRYKSFTNVQLASGAGISFGIRELSLSGRLCVALKPLLQACPIVGGVSVYFASQPRVDLEFSGMSAVAQFPGLAKTVQRTVDSLLGNLVLPNFKFFPITSDERVVNITDASAQEPIGILKVQVLGARNLAGANWRMGSVESFTSDPYCIMRLGSTTSRTSTVQGTTNPKWPSAEPAAYFVVYHREQEFHLDVFDEDRGLLQRNFVGLLGRIRGMSVRDLLQRTEGSVCCVVLDTSQVKSGLLHVDDPVNKGLPSEIDLCIEWRELVPRVQVQDMKPHDVAIGLLLVELHAGTGFPEEACDGRRSLRWRCWLDSEEDPPTCSSAGKLLSEEPDFHLPLAQCLYHTVDQLSNRGVPNAEIAEIVDASEAVVSQYLAAKSDFLAKLAERRMARGEERCVELSWHEKLPILVRRRLDASVIISLVDGDDKAVGMLDPIPLHSLLSGDGVTAKETFRLSRDEKVPSPGGAGSRLSAWLFPYCSKPVLARGRYHAVGMSISFCFRALGGARDSKLPAKQATSCPSSNRVRQERRPLEQSNAHLSHKAPQPSERSVRFQSAHQ
eukprot:TRINITY_DN24807_c0_g1_i1.p1 TRINITY_DN24807_c0_g1~~TRINITY_DN24807_c0_g1_i1.p1  ORF type:complete len:646 (+),score=101.60 TRINITY_DN24807_c0_g1_i1:92-2029(+)